MSHSAPPAIPPPNPPRKPESGKPRDSTEDRLAAFLLKHGLSLSEVRSHRLAVLMDAIETIAPLAGEPGPGSPAPRLDDAEKTAAQLTLLKLLNAVGRYADADVEMFDREERGERARTDPGAGPAIQPSPGSR